jgi:hypothetical protein
MVQAAFPFALPTPALPAGTPAPGRIGTPPAAAAACLPHGADATGFQIGWDFAHHQLVPPIAHLHAHSPVRQGWSAGRAVFGRRTLNDRAPVRQWLALRLAAWQQGQAFEDVQVTPHFLAQISSPHCPVTRLPLCGAGEQAAVLRLNTGAAYAAGNLVVAHRSAAEARADLGCDDLLALAQRVGEQADGQLRGLDVRAWQRLAVLASFATPLPHGLAATLPLLVLPPNRVRVLNPVQALQVMLTLQFTRAGYARRLLTLAALMPGSEARQAFQVFMHTLLSRRLAAGQDAEPAALRRALEDSWADPLVNRRWQRLALWLSAADCERLLLRASQRALCVGGSRWLSHGHATEGWALSRPQADLTSSGHGNDDGHDSVAGLPDPAPTPAQAVAAGSRAAVSARTRQRGSQKLAS